MEVVLEGGAKLAALAADTVVEVDFGTNEGTLEAEKEGFTGVNVELITAPSCHFPPVVEPVVVEPVTADFGTNVGPAPAAPATGVAIPLSPLFASVIALCEVVIIRSIIRRCSLSISES